MQNARIYMTLVPISAKSNDPGRARFFLARKTSGTFALQAPQPVLIHTGGEANSPFFIHLYLFYPV